MRARRRGILIIGAALAVTCAHARAREAAPAGVAGLGAADPREVERAVAAIAQTAEPGADPDLLFAAARACEDKLLDPGRAAALYDRIAAEHAEARVAIAAARRARALHALIGPHGETAAQAAELARLIAGADAAPVAQVIARADRLGDTAWPGAPAAAIWLADWLRRTGRLGDAQARYAAARIRWPAAPQALAALRGGAGCALEARDWTLAEALARQLPAADPAARAERDELLAAAARGRRRTRWYAAGWLAIAAAFAGLLGSLVEAALRSPRGTRRAMLRPPGELLFVAPVAAVLIGVACTAHRLIAPAVATISIGGLGLTWLSGAALERLRIDDRARALRSLAHIAACLAGVAGLGYVALTHGDLLDQLIETVRFGPEP